MALSVDALSNNNDTTTITLDVNHNVNVAADLVVVTVQIKDNTGGDRPVSTVILDPLGAPEGFANIGGATHESGNLRVEAWFIVDPVKSGVSLIRITTDGSVDEISAGIISFFGSNTGAPINVIQTADGANTPPTLSITTTVPGTFVIDSLASGEPGAGKIATVHTPIHVTDLGSNTGASQYLDAGAAGAKTMNYTDVDSDTDWTLSAIAVRPLVARVGGFSGTMIKSWIFG